MTLRAVTIKQTKCEICKAEFTSHSGFVTWCSFDCGTELATAKLMKAKSKAAKVAKVAAVKDKRETKVKLDNLKSRATWAKEAQTAFNEWVRLRDHGNACISCGRQHQGQNHAGHYLSVGARPELRYEPLNVHLQCAPCNTYLSGNIAKYRLNLIAKIGPEFLAWLESYHEPKKYTTDELKVIKADYTAKSRELLKGMV